MTELPSPNVKYDEIAQQLEQGLKVSTRRHHLKTYKDVFLGSEAVSFIHQISRVETREEALQLGRLIAQERGDLFEHVLGHARELEDNGSFYRFVKKRTKTSRGLSPSISLSRRSRHSSTERNGSSSHGGSNDVAIAQNSGEVASDDECTIAGPELENIRDAFEKGVKVSHRKYHIRHNSDLVFTGTDAVSFLVDNKYAKTRKKAIKLGRKLAYEFALFNHVTRDFELEDEGHFYRFTPPEQRLVRGKPNWHTYIGDPGLLRSSGSKGPMEWSAAMLLRNESFSTHAESLPESHGPPLGLNDIADAFEEGVEVKSNLWRNKTYKSTFVGSEAVTFLVSTHMAKTRQDAVRIGQLLMEQHGMFKHVNGKHKFKDKYLFYRFVPRKQRIQAHQPRSKESIPIEEMAQRFKDVVKPSHHVQEFHNTFSGFSAVEALIKARVVTSRSEAVQLGEKLSADMQLFVCVQDETRPFLDLSHVYYRYCEHTMASSLPWLDEDDGPRQSMVIEEEDEDEHETENSLDCRNPNELSTDQLTSENMFRSVDNEYLVGNVDDDDDDDESSLNGSEHHSLPDDMSGVGEASSAVSSTGKSTTGTRYCDKFGFVLDHDGDDKASTITNSKASIVSEGGRSSNGSQSGEDHTIHEIKMRKWELFLSQCALTPSGAPQATSQSKLKYYTRLGLPDALRTRAWTIIAGVDVLVSEREGHYRDLVDEAYQASKTDRQPRLGSIGGISTAGQSVEGIIERDLHRTFPRHLLFYNKNRESGMDDDFGSSTDLLDTDVDWNDSVSVVVENANGGSNTEECSLGESAAGLAELSKQGQIIITKGCEKGHDDLSKASLGTGTQKDEIMSRTLKFNRELQAQDGPSALRRLLRAYSIYDREVGYCQGMNFIAAMFLTFLPEEESFWLFVVVMNEKPYEMRELFGEDMAGTHKALYVSEQLIKQFLPKLYRHLEREDIHLSMFATQWLMTIFTSTFPFDLVARVWDSFLVEGWKVVYRVMLALLDFATPDLMNLHFEEILDYLRDKFPSKVKGRAIMSASLKIPLKKRHIQKHINQWEIRQSRDEYRVRRASLRSESGESVESAPIVTPKTRSKLPSSSVVRGFVDRNPKVEDLAKKLLPNYSGKNDA